MGFSVLEPRSSINIEETRLIRDSMSLQDLGFLDTGKRIKLMFCGKGGTGKTTSFTVTAVHLALQGHRTLLVSTDPAPSLSDIL